MTSSDNNLSKNNSGKRAKDEESKAFDVDDLLDELKSGDTSHMESKKKQMTGNSVYHSQFTNIEDTDQPNND